MASRGDGASCEGDGRAAIGACCDVTHAATRRMPREGSRDGGARAGAHWRMRVLRGDPITLVGN